MSDTPKKKMPKGGRKGGTIFPRLELRKAVEYAGKLVSKTHTGPLGNGVVLAGVFGNSGSDGRIRLSALKQYGLLETTKDGVQASKLAREIEAAPPEEKAALMGRAFLLPKVFRTLHETFQNDTVSRARLRQQTLALKVHPEAAEDCVANFVSSLVTAELGEEAAAGVTLSRPNTATKASDAPPGDLGPAVDAAETPVEELENSRPREEPSSAADGIPAPGNAPAPPGPRAVFQVNITLDSSLDTEKLEKQLQLLRRYGAV